MSVMSVVQSWPPSGRPFTVDDLEWMPDDGRRYELLHGMLLVSPAPTWGHQEVALALAVILREHCPEGMRALGPVGTRLADDSELQPDLVVARRADFAEKYLPKPPLLAVEVQSPSTGLHDLNTKKAAYEEFGVEAYWVVVPDAEHPAVIAFELRAGRYVQVAHVVGDQPLRAERPFPIEVTPSRLVAGLLPD